MKTDLLEALQDAVSFAYQSSLTEQVLEALEAWLSAGLVYVVYQTTHYEGWSVEAIFAVESDAEACAKQLNDAAWADFIDTAKAAYGEDYDAASFTRYDAHLVHPQYLHGSLAAWLKSREAKDEA